MTFGGGGQDKMKIAGMETVSDPPVGRVQHGGLILHRPIAREGPIIQCQPLGSSISATLLQCCAAGRRKVLGTFITEIRFRRHQIAPIG